MSKVEIMFDHYQNHDYIILYTQNIYVTCNKDNMQLKDIKQFDYKDDLIIRQSNYVLNKFI